MSNTVAALLADRKNTRVALATALVERNAEVQALRAQLSVAQRNATQPQATKQVAGTCSALRLAVRKFYEHNPDARSVTPAELRQLGYID